MDQIVRMRSSLKFNWRLSNPLLPPLNNCFFFFFMFVSFFLSFPEPDTMVEGDIDRLCRLEKAIDIANKYNL